jgi:hypothetical protein
MKPFSILAFLALFAGAQAFTYKYDDGVSEDGLTTSGPPTYNPAFLTRYVVQPGAETLISVDVVWGARVNPNLPNGLSAEVWVIQDANNDGNPTNDPLVRSVGATTVSSGTDTFVSYSIAPLTLPVGSGFFVGALIYGAPNGSTWVAIDRNATGKATENWWFPTVGQHTGTNYISLSVFNFPNNAATFMARANAVPEPATLAALGAGALALSRRRRRS